MAELADFIPNVLDFASQNPIRTKEQHENLCMEIYNLIAAQTLQDNQFRMICRFFQVTDVQLQQISEQLGYILHRNPYSLWLLLNWAANPPVVLTREDRATITAHFASVEVNNRLRIWYQQRLAQNLRAGEPQPGEQGLYDSFLGFLNRMQAPKFG